MSRVTGKEHQHISRILLGLIIGLPLPDGMSPSRLVRATRALLDFLYLAQYPTHTSKTLDLLEEHLQAFHENKSIFIDLGIRTNFELPNLHSLDHYRRSIELFGTTDNYDTQYSERLHIDFVKDAYRASNKKEELLQMTVWLERKEKIYCHDKYIEWRLKQLCASHEPRATVPAVMSAALPPAQSLTIPELPPSTAHFAVQSMPCAGPTSSSPMARTDTMSAQSVPRAGSASIPSIPRTDPASGLSVRRAESTPSHTPSHIQMARHPSVKSVSFDDIKTKYSATYFCDALTQFVVSVNYPALTRMQVENQAASVYFPFHSLPIYHKVKLLIKDPDGLAVPSTGAHDVIHARATRSKRGGGELGGRFDTALI